jgi:DNA-directed RNA polymerase specialized sigma24 family protein
LEDAGSLYTHLPDPALTLEETQLRQEVHSAIQRLPQIQRLVTVLFYIGGYSQQEIAAYLELPPVGAIKTRRADRCLHATFRRWFSCAAGPVDPQHK